MFKRSISIIAAIALVTLMFAGCGKNSITTGSEIPEGTMVSKEPIKLTMLYADNAAYPFKKDWIVLDEIKKRTNVELDIQVVPDSDYDTKRTILFSSNSFPDIVTKTYSEQVSDYALNGILLPVSDYSDKLPNFTKKVADWNMGADIDILKEIDGKLYVLPGFSQDLSQTIQLGIRHDLLNNYGIKEPETYDELYNALKTIKQNDPSSLGISERFKGSMLLSIMARSFGTNGGWSLPHGYTYDYNSQKWNFAPTSENYRTMLRYLNKLYNEGLMDPEAFTQDESQFKQKLYNGKIVCAGLWMSEETDMNQQIANATGVKNVNFGAMLPPAGPDGIRGTKSSSRIRQGAAINANVKNKPYFDKLLKFVDWLYYSDEGIQLTNWGVESKTYQNVNGQKEFVSDIKTARNPNGTMNPSKEFGLNTNSFTIVLDPEYSKYSKTVKMIDFMSKLESGNMIPKDDPILKFSDDEKESEKLLESTLQSYYNEMTLKFIFGQASLETDWNSYVNECNNKKLGELMSLVDNTWSKHNK